MVRSGEFDMKKEEKIKYIVGLGFCDLMEIGATQHFGSFLYSFLIGVPL